MANYTDSHQGNEKESVAHCVVELPSSSKRWTEDNAHDFLSVNFKQAMFGPNMLGKTADEAYRNILHDDRLGAGIPLPCVEDPDDLLDNFADLHTLNKLESYKDLLSILDPLDSVGDKALPALTRDIPLHERGCDPARVPGKSQTELTVVKNASLEVRRRYQDVDRCIDNLRQFQRDIRKKMKERSATATIQLVRGVERMAKFLIELSGMLKRCLSFEYMDEDTFKLLFQNFAYIFRVNFRTVSNSTEFRPLTVHGQQVDAKPDLLFENARLDQPVVVVTVGEVKKDSNQKVSQVELGHNSMEGTNDDTCPFPDQLCGRHACQLVAALPQSSMPNKNCILGIVVESTKVRLTCLVMNKVHRLQLEKEDYQPKDHSASIYYTKAYDFFNKSDRYHIVYILVTLASMSRDYADTCLTEALP